MGRKCGGLKAQFPYDLLRPHYQFISSHSEYRGQENERGSCIASHRIAASAGLHLHLRFSFEYFTVLDTSTPFSLCRSIPTIPSISKHHPRPDRQSVHFHLPLLHYGEPEVPRHASSGFDNRSFIFCKRRRSTRQSQYGEDTRRRRHERRSHCMLVEIK